MKDNSIIQNCKFKLSPFNVQDYPGIVSLHNILFPNNPASEDSLRYYDKIREKKIHFERLIWEKDKQIRATASFGNLSWSYHPKTFDIDIRVHPESWFIALDGEKIVGISNLWKRKEHAGINTGFSGVHRDYRCMGIASSLKHTALKWAKKKNYPWVRTENDSTNKGMLGINIKAGFKPMPSWLFMSKVVNKL